jgi:hypothetical protein
MSNSSRQFPQRPSPLAHHWVAPGFHYDVHTGLVSQHQNHYPSQPAAVTTGNCLPGANEYERICPDGVKVDPRPIYSLE